MNRHLFPRPVEIAWLAVCVLLRAAACVLTLVRLRAVAAASAAAFTFAAPRVRRSAIAFARGLATTAFLRVRRKNIRDLLAPESAARLDAVLRRIEADGDVILLGIHLGPFELLPDLSAALNRPVRYLHREYGWPPLDRMIRFWRCPAPSLTYVTPRSARELVRFGLESGTAGLLIDGWPKSSAGPHGCSTFSPAPVSWAARRRVPIWVASLWHEPAGLGFDASRVAPASEFEMAAAVRRLFESAVAAHPDDWICFCETRRLPAVAAETEVRHGVPAV